MSINMHCPYQINKFKKNQCFNLTENRSTAALICWPERMLGAADQISSRPVTPVSCEGKLLFSSRQSGGFEQSRDGGFSFLSKTLSDDKVKQ